MAAWIGSIENFNPQTGNFETYIERVEQLFLCNEVSAEKKACLFLTFIGGETYAVLKDLLAPDAPSAKTYAELKTALETHFKPKIFVIAERVRFHSCRQEPNEDIASFEVKLRNLAKNCDFGAFLSQALRDKFVWGLHSENIQRKLLTIEDLTFANAVATARGMELASQQSKMLNPGAVHKIKSQSVKSKSSVKKNKDNKQGNSTSGESHPSGRREGAAIAAEEQQGQSTTCTRCGRQHEEASCPAKNWKCFNCQRRGHSSKMCRTKVNQIDDNADDTDDDLTLGALYTKDAGGVRALGSPHTINRVDEPVYWDIKLDERVTKFEVDSGASRSVMSENQFKELFPNVKLRAAKCRLTVVTGGRVLVVGEAPVTVTTKRGRYDLSLVVIRSALFVPLLGRNWLDALWPEWRAMFDPTRCQISIKPESEGVKQVKAVPKMDYSKYPSVFDGDKGSCIKGFEVEIKLKEGSSPVFRRAYNVPFATREKVESELEELVQSGVLEKVTKSNWATPVVVVEKNDGKIRLCGDFSSTINPVIELEHYPLPLPEDIFASLAGAKCFTVLDLRGAYQQLKVRETSREFLTVNTLRGLYRYTRLCFGLSSAPAIFQCVMDQILGGLDKVFTYLDDILIGGIDEADCREKLETVLQRLEDHNVKVNKAKCKWFEESVTYLGFQIDAVGIHPTKQKVEAFLEAPEPQNLKQLQSYLGGLSFYSRFLPNSSTLLSPLFELLKKNVPFRWSKECREAFEASKQLLFDNQVLVHYDPGKPLILACDASQYGVGAVLSHLVEGVERPIAFASSTLSKAEKNYAQIEREALAVIFGVKRFHKYLYGRQFTLYTDHKPLEVIFNPGKALNVLAAGRIIRWRLILSNYRYQVNYRKGSLLGNADVLSRLPLNQPTGVAETLYAFNEQEGLVITPEEVAFESAKDRELVKVLDLTKRGWAEKLDDEQLKPYHRLRHELSIENGCVLFGSRVVIPKVLRRAILELLHETHIGIVRTRMLARSLYWWPGMDTDIEVEINACNVCQMTRNEQHDVALQAWPSPENNFERVHVDFFQFGKDHFLIIYDAKSKWIDVHIMAGTCAASTIDKLRQSFAIFGLPTNIVSDNGPPFDSKEFYRFCQANEITVLKSPPYHPQSNGSAERGVGTVKRGLTKVLLENKDKTKRLTIFQVVQNFLFSYRNTPSSITGVSPASLIFKRIPRSRFNIVKPEFGKRKLNGKVNEAKKTEILIEGEAVWIANKNRERNCPLKWVPGHVIEQLTELTYRVQIDDKSKVVHKGDLRKRIESTATQPAPSEEYYPPLIGRENADGSGRRLVEEAAREGVTDYSGSQSEGQTSGERRLSIPLVFTEQSSSSDSYIRSPAPRAGHSSLMAPKNNSPAPLRRTSRVSRPPVKLNL